MHHYEGNAVIPGVFVMDLLIDGEIQVDKFFGYLVSFIRSLQW